MFIPENIVGRGRLFTLVLIIFFVFCVMVGRFYYLQIYQHQKYVTKADAKIKEARNLFEMKGDYAAARLAAAKARTLLVSP